MSTEILVSKSTFPTKVKKFYPVYKSRIVKSRKKSGTGAGVRSYRGVNLIREKAFAESRKGVKKIPRQCRRIFGRPWTPLRAAPGGAERAGPIQSITTALESQGRRTLFPTPGQGRALQPVHFSLEAACTMGERRPDPRKQWDERGRRLRAGGGSPQGRRPGASPEAPSGGWRGREGRQGRS